MENPLVTVLIPTYNVEKYVRTAVMSILNQTYRNLEILIIDDGSTDATYSILEELAAKDERIRLFRNAVNLKIVKTLNEGVVKSRGMYIARMDGDDISHPERIEKQVSFLQKNPSFDLVGLNVVMIDDAGTEIHKERYPVVFDDIKRSLPLVSPVPHFWLARKSLYEAVGEYRIPGAEDYDFIYRAVDLGHKVNNLKEYLYYQRIRLGNTATNSGLAQKKSVQYVRILHHERLQGGLNQDRHSDSRVKEVTNSGDLEKKLFKVSSNFHLKYLQLKNENKIKAVLMLGLACTISPFYQLDAILRRSKYKKILNTEI